MKFTTAATILTVSIFGTTDGATPCNQLTQGEHVNHFGAGTTEIDPAFIHDNCKLPDHYPEYYKADEHDLTFGTGWYCNDKKDVKDMTCDEANIDTGCTGTGDQHVTYKSGSWECDKSLDKSADDQDEDAAINGASVVMGDTDAAFDSSSDTPEKIEAAYNNVLAVEGLGDDSAAASDSAVARITVSSAVVVATMAVIM